jgi:succinate-semialdehyde dehydrogenase/glutarate-semialdehyde dehydrogenase
MIVLEDVDPQKAAADAAYACFSAMGQLCVSMERIYVHRSVAGPFIRALVDRLDTATLGSSLEYSSDFGSLASPAQLARVESHLDDAIAKGAMVLTGGRPRPDIGPWFFQPTVLTGVSPEMRVHAEETFGAIASLYIVDTEDEAILAANASEYGLNASVLTRSARRGRRVADALEAGSVNINEGYRGSFGSVDAPMGGVKASGVGRRNGPEGLLRFVEPVTVSRATGLLQLPRTGREFKVLAGPFLLLARVLRAMRRR